MPSQPPLQPQQFDRYRRHLTLPELGVDGQLALLLRALVASRPFRFVEE